MELKRIPIDSQNISDEYWGRFIEYFHHEHERLRPNDPLEPDEVIIERLKYQMNDEQINFYAESLVDPSTDKMVGFYLYVTLTEKHPAYANNPDLATVEIDLFPEYRGKGIAHELLRDALERLEKDRKTLVISNSSEEAGAEFIKKLGGMVAQVNIENRVYLKDIDMEMIDRWIRDGQERSPDTRLEFFNTIPDEIAENFCSTYQRTVNQVPRDDVAFNDFEFSVKDLRKREEDLKNMNLTSLTGVTIEPDGTISSLSEFTYSPTNPKKLSQGLTSTLEEHRGRGLGKWVKAAMIRKAMEVFPEAEFISTSNATSNAPMLSINERLGFRKYKEHYTLQITTDKLREYLHGKVS